MILEHHPIILNTNINSDKPSYEMLDLVQEWITRDILIQVEIRIGNQKCQTLYAVAERDITSEEIMTGVVCYLKHQNAPGACQIVHGILTVS